MANKLYNFENTSNPCSEFKKNFFAFTLAEVLITVGIIGLIAMMTIPSLIQKNQELQIISTLKKNYSVFTQAYLLAVEEYNTPDLWGFGSHSGNDILSKMSALRIQKNCKNDSGCFAPNVKIWNTSIDSSASFSKLMLHDGTLVATFWRGNTPLCGSDYGTTESLKNTCAYIFLDLNGFKSPNTFGKDIFSFYLTKFGIVPLGTENETNSFKFQGCKRTYDGDFNYGLGCTAWILQTGNMDYLHCNDLDWGGKHKCK